MVIGWLILNTPFRETCKMILKNLLLVGAGGMLGSMLRYGVYVAFKSQQYPVATWTVNIAGSFAIGLVTALALRSGGISADWRLFLATGICGGFTTFSAFSMECVQLISQNKFWQASVYIFISLLVGLSATFAGMYSSKIF